MPDAVILNGRYYLEQRLGSGGMAVVYLAKDLMLERSVAVKLLRKNFSGDAEFRNRFRQEAKAAANLSHPNIVTVYDFGLSQDQIFIVMEYVPGIDLKTLIERKGRLDVDEALALMIQACEGIGHAHSKGLVHCDIKPQNLLVTPDQRLKVVDFGIARAMASISPDEKSEIVWGSPKYFSPEQAKGSAPSPASDVYSLGIVLYEALTGQVPFQADLPEELVRMHKEELPPPPRKLNPLIPTQIEEFLLLVLSKEPSSRYPNADQMGHALVNFRESLELRNEPVSRLDMDPTAQIGPLPQVTLHKAESQVTHVSHPTYERRSDIPDRRYPRNVTVARGLGIDWITWLLALFALIAVGGLIPFWLWVYYILYPPVK